MTKGSRILVILAYLGFVGIGIPDGLLGVAWPSVRATFHLPVSALGNILLTFTAGYILSTFRSGWLQSRLRTGLLLATGCLAAASVLFGFALAGSWEIVVPLAAIAGIGAGIIDAGLNTYAASHFTRRTVSYLHAFYGLGAATGPLLMTAILMAHMRWQSGYFAAATFHCVLAACFLLTSRLWKRDASHTEHLRVSPPALASLRLLPAQLGVAAFLLYTGVEAAAGAWAYSVFTESRGIAAATAGTWVSIYWAALTSGRFLSGAIADHIHTRALLRICILGMMCGTALLCLHFSGPVSFSGLVLTGLFAAPVFPTLISSTPGRLGESHTANVIGFQLAGAVAGQSLLPAATGWLAGAWTLEVFGPVLLVASSALFLVHEMMCLAGLPREAVRGFTVNLRTGVH